jgi:hypothetical protein
MVLVEIMAATTRPIAEVVGALIPIIAVPEQNKVAFTCLGITMIEPVLSRAGIAIIAKEIGECAFTPCAEVVRTRVTVFTNHVHAGVLEGMSDGVGRGNPALIRIVGTPTDHTPVAGQTAIVAAP